MTDNIVNLDDRRPHQATYVACIQCGKDWVAAAPADTLHFECPDCHTLDGVEVKPASVEFLNNFFRGIKSKKELTKRSLVVLNAKRMIEGQQL